jgi:Arc/MetJ-type ribon-helix-helix transcriptional regulator
MAIVLSPDVQQQIEELVRSGRFSSADELFRWYVKLDRELEEERREVLAAMHARRDEIEGLLEEAERDIAEGRFTVYDDDGLKALFEEIKREGRRRMGLPADAP